MQAKKLYLQTLIFAVQKSDKKTTQTYFDSGTIILVFHKQIYKIKTRRSAGFPMSVRTLDPLCSAEGEI